MSGSMMQGLLEDYFKLKMHREAREARAYALAVAEAGPRLPRAVETCVSGPLGSPGVRNGTGQMRLVTCGRWHSLNGGMHIAAGTVADLVQLCTAGLGRPIIDETRIVGRFDIQLEVTPADLGFYGRRSLPAGPGEGDRSEEHTSELQSLRHI